MDNGTASTTVLDEIRSFWDADAPTYDNATGHHPRTRRSWRRGPRRSKAYFLQVRRGCSTWVQERVFSV